MTISKKTSGMMLATAAAALFTSGCATQKTHHDHDHGTADAGKVSCGGINACKGQSACKTATNSCGGQNGCKGQGLLKTTQADCEAKGGTILEDPHHH